MKAAKEWDGKLRRAWIRRDGWALFEKTEYGDTYAVSLDWVKGKWLHSNLSTPSVSMLSDEASEMDVKSADGSSAVDVAVRFLKALQANDQNTIRETASPFSIESTHVFEEDSHYLKAAKKWDGKILSTHVREEMAFVINDSDDSGETSVQVVVLKKIGQKWFLDDINNFDTDKQAIAETRWQPIALNK